MRLGTVRTWKRAVQGLALCSLVLSGWICQAGIRIQSDSLLRFYDREDSNGGGHTIAPGYEYLQVDLGQLDADGISFHGQAWGRYDFSDNDYFDSRAAGEALYGYLEYYRSSYKAFARLGRQSIFSGTSNLAIDGLRLGSDLTSYFSVEAWGGQPVALEEINGRSGDKVWGARVENHFGSLYAVGLSYKRIEDDSQEQHEVLAVDSSLQPPQIPIMITGYSARNMETDAWQEHSYNAKLYGKQYRIGASVRRYELGDFASRGRFTGTPFVFGAGNGVRLTQLGAEAAVTPTKAFELGARYRRTDNNENDDVADFGALFAIAHMGDLTQAGVELGLQTADEEENEYALGRAFGYWDKAPMFVSADVVLARYKEKVMDEKSSLFVSLGTGMRFLNDSLEARVAGDYSKDPYFDSDVRGLFSLTYKFTR